MDPNAPQIKIKKQSTCPSQPSSSSYLWACQVHGKNYHPEKKITAYKSIAKKENRDRERKNKSIW